MSEKKQIHASGGIRHSEKRRTGTCLFSDRIARNALKTYYERIPRKYHENKTCVAAIIAHFRFSSELQVMGLGAGTKFLKEDVLRNSFDDDYGVRIRDSHAEVLARRSFQRQLSVEILHHITGDNVFPKDYKNILNESMKDNEILEMKPGVTLHMYISSAPCGNATLKKFSKMKKEKFDHSLSQDELPIQNHSKIHFHCLPQFSLLVKKDCIEKLETQENSSSDAWCPPGTSIVGLNKGSIHTCSDKICRWNCLGLQGSLLSFFIKQPLFLTSLTVGRKFTECICRRACCCRAYGFEFESQHVKYMLNHLVLMGTGVYMDEEGSKFTQKIIILLF